MKVTVESTSEVVFLDGVLCRVWEGETERGVKISAFIPRVAVKDEGDLSQFEEELIEQRPPTPDREIPLRLIL